MRRTYNTKDVIAWALLVAVLVVHPACDLGLDDGPYTPPDPCKVSEGHVDPGSSWSIASLHGSGSRSGCSDEAYNKPFEFKLATSIPITQTTEGGSPQFHGSLGDTFLVSEGEIHGICVSFQTAETIPGVEVVRRTFVGEFDQFHESIKGDFSGLGPSNCEVNGTFRAVLGP